MHEFEVCKLDHIQSEAATLNWNDKDGVADYQRRVAGQFENSKLLAGKHEADTNELTDIESSIKAYIVEASYYFPSHVFKQLNKTVAEGFKGDVIAADYRSMSREELYAFYPEAYRKAVTEKRDYVSGLREKTINSVAEILRE
jgi:hypothetical protein